MQEQKITKIILEDKTVLWTNEDGFAHREDGPAIIYPTGIEEWYQNDILHREDGPAYINPNNGLKIWYQNGLRHREDGPAIEHSNGTVYWYANGVNYQFEEWIRRIDLTDKNSEEITMLMLKHNL